MTERDYTITEVEAISGISAFTLRYYDKCGFFPHIRRDARKKRFYRDADIRRLKLIESLRLSGLSIDGISAFLRAYDAGEFDAVSRMLEGQLFRLGMLQEQVISAREHLSQVLNEWHTQNISGLTPQGESENTDNPL